MNASPIHTAIAVVGTQSGLAARLGVQSAQVHQWASGARPVPLAHCLAIERATHGVVMRADLRPNDYWLIWPDLPAPAHALDGEALAPG